MRLKTISKRLIVTGGVVLSLLLLINAALSIYFLRQNTIQERSGQLSNLTLMLTDNATQIMFSANTMMDAMLSGVNLENIQTQQAFNAHVSTEEQFAILSDKTKANPIIDVATFVSAQGKVLNFSREFPPPNIDLSDRDYFKWLSTHDDPNTFYSLPVQNKGNGKWVFYLARRIDSNQNEFLGLALVGISVEVFTALYEKIGHNLGTGIGLSLYREDKVLLIRWPYRDGIIGKINESPHIDQALSRNDQSAGVFFVSTPSLAGETAIHDRMISIKHLDKYPLFIAASMTKDLYLSGWVNSAINIVYTIGFSLIIIFIGMALLIRAYEMNNKIKFIAEHDPLTTLPNRILLEGRLEQALAIAQRNDKKFALLYIDIDHFKNINDSLGHDVGDELLNQIAQKIRDCIRMSDTASRVGGDEFIVLLYDVENSDVVLHVAEKILTSIHQSIKVSDLVLQTSASIGVAIYPEHGRALKTLKKHADFAMYYAKKMGRNQVQLFKNV